MRYWLLKTKPARCRYDQDLKPGFDKDWRSARPRSALRAGVRLFLWESSPHHRAAGFGEVVKPVQREDEDRLRVFRVRHPPHRLAWMPGIDVLKANRKLKFATFPKAGTRTRPSRR